MSTPVLVSSKQYNRETEPNTPNNNNISNKQSSNNNYIRERVYSSKLFTNINNSKERVRQRLTSYKHINIYNKKNIVLNFRISIDYLEKLDIIIEKLGARNVSEALRHSIDIVYGIVSSVQDINAGTVIIQSPVINIVKAEAKAESKSKSEINVDFSEILSELSEIKKLISNWHRMKLIPKAAYDTVSSRLKRIEKMIKQVN